MARNGQNMDDVDKIIYETNGKQIFKIAAFETVPTHEKH